VQHATISYRKAIKLNVSGAPAWMGLAEIAESGSDASLAIDAYEHLVRCTYLYGCLYILSCFCVIMQPTS